MEGEDERRLRLALEREIRVNHPVVGMDDVRPLLGDDPAESAHDAGVGERRKMEPFVRVDPFETVHHPLDTADADSVQILSSGRVAEA